MVHRNWPCSVCGMPTSGFGMTLCLEHKIAHVIEHSGQAFDAWREKHDPNHELPIEKSAQAYCLSETIKE